MKKTVIDFILLENKQLNKDNFLLILQSPIQVSDILPGQFINVEIKDSSEIFLRRPFSILDVDYDRRTISLLVKILGRGSKKLTTAQPGDIVNAIIPLGKSFSFPEKTDNILLIGGGSGVAPMLFMAKSCGLAPSQISVLIGARSQSDHIDISEYLKYGAFYMTTEDGTMG